MPTPKSTLILPDNNRPQRPRVTQKGRLLNDEKLLERDF